MRRYMYARVHYMSFGVDSWISFGIELGYSFFFFAMAPNGNMGFWFVIKKGKHF